MDFQDEELKELLNIFRVESEENFADYKACVIKSNTKEPLVAQQFVEFINTEEGQMLRYETNATVPTLLSLADDPSLKENVASVGLMEQSAVAVQQPNIQQISEYWTPAKALGDGIVYGEITEANLQSQLDAMVQAVTTSLVN